MIISTYSIGKEELLLILAKHFSTKIIVEQRRYDVLNLLNFPIDLFSADDN